LSFKSPVQPLCRYCAKPIAKETDTVYVRDPRGGNMRSVIEGPLHSKEECQSRVNTTVLSVSYHLDISSLYGESGRDPGQARIVNSFTVWDGVSYKDEFFCNGVCASRFAYLMARAGHCTVAHNEALARQNGARQVRSEELV
jgi:hypothetical protein